MHSQAPLTYPTPVSPSPKEALWSPRKREERLDLQFLGKLALHPPTTILQRSLFFLVHELIDSCKKDYRETHIASDGMHTNDPKGPLPTLADEGKHPLLLTAKVTRVKETK